MTEIMRTGGGSWIGRLITKFREPGFMVEMPCEPEPPEPRKRQAHPDCPRCQAGQCSVDHLMAGLAFGRTGWDGSWGDIHTVQGVRHVYPR